MVRTWWIRRWYILYISVFTILPIFRKKCHEKFSIFQTLFKRDYTNFSDSQTHY
ncbi:hypothetical protein Hanom_Chr16g01415311 [Helianthus anomalus]